MKHGKVTNQAIVTISVTRKEKGGQTQAARLTVPLNKKVSFIGLAKTQRGYLELGVQCD